MVSADRGSIRLVQHYRLHHQVLLSLDPVVAERMAGDVAAVPTDGKYEYLKSKFMASQMIRKQTGSLTSLGLAIGNLPSSVHTSKVSQSIRMSSCDEFFCASYLKMSVCK